MPDTSIPSKSRQALRKSNEEANRITKECLQTALVWLLKKKTFDKITITELTKKAGVSRTAFYRNYLSKEELLTELCDRLLRELAASLLTPKYRGNLYQWLYDAFTTAIENAETVEMILKSDLPRDLPEWIYKILETIMPPRSPEERYRLIAIESAFSSIIIRWFSDGMKEPPEQMAEICSKLAKNL